MYSLKEYLLEALINHRNDDDNVVDFGLSVKWLKYNLAGNKLTDDESDYGYYYQWGSISSFSNATKHIFDWDTTPYCGGSRNSFTKYVINSKYSKYGTVDNKTTLEPMDDAVTALLGSKYRMPTKDEFKELYNHCGGKHSGSLSGTTSVSSKGIYWVKSNSVIDGIKYKNPGCLFVGQNITKRIFFPASGYYSHSSVEYAGSCCSYWSSSLVSSQSDLAHYLFFNSNYGFPAYNTDGSRYYGFSVRGVKVK